MSEMPRNKSFSARARPTAGHVIEGGAVLELPERIPADPILDRCRRFSELYDRIANAVEIGHDPDIRRADRQMINRRPVVSLLKPLEAARKRHLQEGGTASIHDCREIIKGGSDFETCVPIIDRLLEQNLEEAVRHDSGPLHDRAIESFTELLAHRIIFAGEPRKGVVDALAPVLGTTRDGKPKTERAMAIIKDSTTFHPSPAHTILGQWKKMERELGELKVHR